jgi:hypothetical protein
LRAIIGKVGWVTITFPGNFLTNPRRMLDQLLDR